MIGCRSSVGPMSVIIRLGFFGSCSMLATGVDNVLTDNNGIFGIEQVTTSNPIGCKDEIEGCRSKFLSEGAGLSGEKMCAAFHLYQDCYYRQIHKCNWIEKSQQDKQFIAARDHVFEKWPKCKISTTPWDASMWSSGSDSSDSLSGFDGSMANSILSDSGSGSSGTEPFGPISGSAGLYMNIGQWVVLGSCCLCCLLGLCTLAACCHQRKRAYYDYDDEFDEEDMYPFGPVAHTGARMPTMGYPGHRTGMF